LEQGDSRKPTSPQDQETEIKTATYKFNHQSGTSETLP
jgi:hypothetical protein